MINRRVFLKAGTAALAGGAAPDIGRTAPARPPNIVVFLVDDLGWADLSCQGSTFYETPRVDELARDGVRFTNAYSACPVCSPSRAALMTGKYPGSVGFTGHITALLRHRYKPHGRVLPPDDYMFLRHEETTIAETLKQAGYTSANIGKWHLGSRAYWPDRHGFDVNIGGYDHGSPPSYFDPYENPDQQWNDDIPTLADRRPGEYLTDRLTDEAITFLEQNRDRPFFLYLSHFAVHTPLQAPRDLVAKYEKKLAVDDSQFSATYAAMIEKMDDSLGRVVDALKRLELMEQTLVLFTSDNGGELKATRNTPLREGKGFLFEGGIRVPLIAAWKDRIDPGRVVDQPVCGIDLYATLSELAGALTLPVVTQGQSLGPLLWGNGHWPQRDLYWYYPHYSPRADRPGAAIRSGNYKLIESYDPIGVELYDLAADLGETRNLADVLPERTAELRKRLNHWIGDNVRIPHRLNTDYDPGVAAREKPQ